MRYRHGVHIYLVFFANFLLVLSTTCLGTELSLGLAMVDEMDDRPKPAATVSVGFLDQYLGQIYTYGRQHGVVHEDTQAISLFRLFPLFAKGSYFSGGIGLAFVRENTEIEAISNSEGDFEAQEEAFYNLGMAFKLGILVFPKLNYLKLRVNWDSQVYLAGQAGLFLATGRKQFISLTGGIEW